jgi:glycosyltransferase involved in cell wall biosynthesis
MKVLHIISSLDANSGGTTTACVELATAQRRHGMEVAILSTWRSGESLGGVEILRDQHGEGFVTLVGPTQGLLRGHPDLQAAIARAIGACDVVHVHGVWEAIQHQAVRQAIRLGKPVVWASHGMLDPWSLAQGRWKKKLFWWWHWRKLAPEVAAMHYITRSEARLAAPMTGGAARNIVEPLGTAVPEAGTRQPCGRRVLFLSRLHPKKNVECLLEACAGPVAEPWSLTLAGGGDAVYQKSLEERIRTLGIEARVTLAGDVRGREKSGLFAAADLFCLPSHQENFGIVVIEALAHGVPVLISPAVGLAEDLAGERAVRVIDGGAAEWARAIDAALGDDKLRKDAAEGGPELVAKRFSWEAIAQRWEGHYEMVGMDRRAVPLVPNGARCQ